MIAFAVGHFHYVCTTVGKRSGSVDANKALKEAALQRRASLAASVAYVTGDDKDVAAAQAAVAASRGTDFLIEGTDGRRMSRSEVHGCMLSSGIAYNRTNRPACYRSVKSRVGAHWQRRLL